MTSKRKQILKLKIEPYKFNFLKLVHNSKAEHINAFF